MRRIVSFLGVCAVMAVLGVGIVFFTGCKKDAGVKKEIFSGYAQKGPFVVGSSVTIFELDANLNQTGKTYLTTISDNSGSFEQKNIELVSNYAELKADGFYFHEIGGCLSIAPITLYALVDIANANSANVNVLTHLEKPRVEYLIKQGKSFAEAKQQAQREIFAIFGFSPSQTPSEALNLTSNAMLIAISCILQNHTTTSEMAELMANISAGIKTNGTLNATLKTKLVNQAIALTIVDVNDNRTSLWRVRNNMETKYAEMGINVTIPDFESYVLAFIDANK